MPITTCDFCDRQLDEDEELIPLYFGEPPKRSFIIGGESPCVEDTTRREYGSDGNDRTFLDHTLMGYRVVHIVALLNAIANSERMDLSTFDYKHEPTGFEESVEWQDPTVSADGGIQPSEFDETEKPSVELRVESSGSINREPVMRVCEHCHKGLIDEGAS